MSFRVVISILQCQTEKCKIKIKLVKIMKNFFLLINGFSSFFPLKLAPKPRPSKAFSLLQRRGKICCLTWNRLKRKVLTQKSLTFKRLICWMLLHLISFKTSLCKLIQSFRKVILNVSYKNFMLPDPCPLQLYLWRNR